jgi:hypothetical protein
MTQLLLYESSQQIRHQSSVLSKVTEQMMTYHQEVQSGDSVPLGRLFIEKQQENS